MLVQRKSRKLFLVSNFIKSMNQTYKINYEDIVMSWSMQGLCRNIGQPIMAVLAVKDLIVNKL